MAQSGIKHRPLSLNEKLYIVGEDISPPMAIQMIVKGEGVLDELAVSKSVQELKSIIPAIQYIVHGKSWGYRDELNILTVHQKEIPIDSMDPIFMASLGNEDGKLFEMHLFQGVNSAVVFRAHHALVDGRGLLLIIETFFKLLNGLSVEPILDFPKEADIQKRIRTEKDGVLKSPKIEFRSTWKGLYTSKQTSLKPSQNAIIELKDRHSFIIGKLAAWYSRRTNAPAKFLIPVDIRNHLMNFQSVANLSCPIYLSVTPDESPDEIHGRLIQKLIDKEELAPNPLEFLGKIIPIRMMSSVFKRLVKTALKKNIYQMSGFLSDLGFISLNDFSTKTFKSIDFLVIPVFSSLSPFCVMVCQHSGGTRIGLNVPSFYNLNEIKQSLEILLMENLNEPVAEKSEGNAETDETIKAWAHILGVETSSIQSNTTYESLCGSSMDLVLIISELDEQMHPDTQSEFLKKTLFRGGKITPALMSNILSELKKNEN